MIYEKLGIKENQKANSPLENFLKWTVDELVIWNYELAIDIWNTNGKIILDSLKQLATWEWIKKVTEWLGESIWNLFSWSAYEKWKSAAQLWLLTTVAGVWLAVGRKWFRVGMKELKNFRAHKENIPTSPEVKWVVQETSKKVEELVPKKQIDFEKLLVEDVKKLWPKERLEAGSFYLKGKKFTPEQEQAILKAHETGIPNKDGKFSVWDLRKKYIILEKAWFNDNEIRTLMEKGVCWKEKLPKWDILYSHPEYSFLEKYKEVLWENLNIDDIVWEWQNAVIIANKKDPWYVVKVAKDKKWVDNLKIELANHKIFYGAYLEWLTTWKISQNIIIPEIKDIWKEWAFLVWRIHWETLYSQSVRKVLESKWIQLEKWMSDKAIDSLVDKKYSYLQGEINKQAYKDLASTLGINHFDEVLWIWYYLDKNIDNPVLNAMRYIKEHTPNWLIHNDLHSGNIMIDWDKIYIIDYWKVKKTK